MSPTTTCAQLHGIIRWPTSPCPPSLCCWQLLWEELRGFQDRILAGHPQSSLFLGQQAFQKVQPSLSVRAQEVVGKARSHRLRNSLIGLGLSGVADIALSSQARQTRSRNMRAPAAVRL